MKTFNVAIWLSALIFCNSVYQALGKIDCHYCGIRKLCTLPYVDTSSEKITCDKSCMKFDGEAPDGKRVLVRSCGFEDTNICNKTTEWNGSRGEKCICNAENCNSSNTINARVGRIIKISTISFLAIFMFTRHFN